MRRRRALYFALCGVAAVAACSGYSSSNGGGDAPDGGGAPDAADATPPPVPPGSSDAGPDGPWCQVHEPGASVCDDFDEPGTFSGKWTKTDAYHGTETVVDDVAARSSPRVLLTATDGTASDISVAALDWQVASATTVAYGFAVRVDHAASPVDGGANGLALFQLSVTSASGTGFITFHPSQGLNHFANDPDGGTIYGRTITGLPPVDDGAWHEVVVKFSLTPPRAITVSIDGATPKDDELGTGFDPGGIYWSACVTYAQPGNDGWKIAFDDVWLEAH